VSKSFLIASLIGLVVAGVVLAVQVGLDFLVSGDWYVSPLVLQWHFVRNMAWLLPLGAALSTFLLVEVVRRRRIVRQHASG